MSLINCPECGKQVSSSAHQCVHCGCSYTVCPECGKVYIGILDKCTNCGYDILKPSKKHFFKSEQNSTATNENNILTVWQERSFVDNKVMTILRFFSLALSILVMILCLIACIVIWTWDETKLESLTTLSTVNTNAHNLIIAACVLGVLVPIIFNFIPLYAEVMCGSWLRKNNYDITPYVKKIYGSLELNDVNDKVSNNIITSAGYLSKVPSDKNILITKFIILCIIAIIATVCIGIFLTQNLEEWLNVKIYSRDFIFQYKAGIFAVVSIILYYIVKFSFNSYYDKRKMRWVESLN
jgi:hypothetical protein